MNTFLTAAPVQHHYRSHLLLQSIILVYKPEPNWTCLPARPDVSLCIVCWSRFLLGSDSVIRLENSYLPGDAGDDGDFPRLAAVSSRTGSRPRALSHRRPVRVRKQWLSVFPSKWSFSVCQSVSESFASVFLQRQIQTKHSTDAPREANQRADWKWRSTMTYL